MMEELAAKIAAEMQKARDEIGATQQQRIAFAYAEAAMRHAIAMEAATAGETAGLDPKDDSAGRQASP